MTNLVTNDKVVEKQRGIWNDKQLEVKMNTLKVVQVIRGLEDTTYQ